MKPMNHQSQIEPLEARIAPATIINAYTVTYQNLVNGGAQIGDTVVVHISKPLFTSPAAAAKILMFTDANGNSISESFTGNGTPEFLNEINLLARTNAQDMNISVKLLSQVGIGSQEASVGSIQAANFSVPNQVSQNIDLGSVYIQGNLGFINVGDDFNTPALHSLTVLSMTDDLQSNVLGPIGKMNVMGDFTANMQLIGYQFGTIDKLIIGGALTGDSTGDSATGVIQFTGKIRSATIGSISGTAADNTGELIGTSANPTKIGSLDVLGSITGGAGNDSGRVFAESSIGKVTVAGSVLGGAGQDSGEIAGPLGTVKITGGLTGSSGISSGTVLSETMTTAGTVAPMAIGSVAIGGDVTGGTAGVAATSSAAATPGDSGIISALTAHSISIAGSLIGGTASTMQMNSSGTLDQTADTSGTILVNSVKSLTVGGNITGGTGPNSGLITGQTGVLDMKYGSVVVNGGVTGGSGATSGSILVSGLFEGTIGSLSIGGSVAGGTANHTGEILATGKLTAGLIKGSLAGSTAIDSDTAVVDAGYLQAGQIGTLSIKGDVTSGINSGAGALANVGAIRSGKNIVSLSIGGEVTGTSANPVVISAASGASTSSRPKTDVAIQSVTIGQAVDFLDLLAGYSPTVSTGSGTTANPAGAPLGTPTDGSAQIGTVTFGSSLTATNVVAGVMPDSNGEFGTAGDAAIPTGIGDVHSTIAGIIVDGQVNGTSSGSFGFVAELLKNVMVDGATVPTAGLVVGMPEAINGTNEFLLVVAVPT